MASSLKIPFPLNYITNVVCCIMDKWMILHDVLCGTASCSDETILNLEIIYLEMTGT